MHNSDTPASNMVIPRVNTAPTGAETQAHLADRLSTGAHVASNGESCPAGLRRGSAAPVEDRVLSLSQNFFQISRTPTTWDRIRRFPGSIPCRTVFKPCKYTSSLLIGWSSWTHRKATAAPLANVEVPPHPGRTESHPRIRPPSKSL